MVRQSKQAHIFPSWEHMAAHTHIISNAYSRQFSPYLVPHNVDHKWVSFKYNLKTGCFCGSNFVTFCTFQHTVDNFPPN